MQYTNAFTFLIHKITGFFLVLFFVSLPFSVSSALPLYKENVSISGYEGGGLRSVKGAHFLKDKATGLSTTMTESTFLQGATYLAMAESQQKSSRSPKSWDVESNSYTFKGTIIGWLFFGQPYEGVGLFDIILLAFIGWVLLKVIKSSSGGGNYPSNDTPTINSHSLPSQEADSRTNYSEDIYNRFPDEADKSEIQQKASSAWSALRSKPAREEQQSLASGTKYEGSTPKDFDADDFLKGAKILYSRYQYSWAARDLKDLEPFTTDELMDALKEHAKKDPTPVPIEILLVNASLASVERKGSEEKAVVLFTTLFQEIDEGAPFELKELWHFTHDYEGDVSWRLDAVETVE